jgi:hypothetical protein
MRHIEQTGIYQHTIPIKRTAKEPTPPGDKAFLDAISLEYPMSKHTPAQNRAIHAKLGTQKKPGKAGIIPRFTKRQKTPEEIAELEDSRKIKPTDDKDDE